MSNFMVTVTLLTAFIFFTFRDAFFLKLLTKKDFENNGKKLIKKKALRNQSINQYKRASVVLVT